MTTVGRGEPLRVLHLIESLARGGAERQLVNLLRNMTPARISSSVCHLYPKGALRAELEADGIPVVSLDMRSRWDLAAGMPRLYRLLTRTRPSVVHTWLYDADLLGRVTARLARVPVVVSALQNSSYEPETLQSTGLGPFKLALLKAFDAGTGRLARARFVASSQFVRDSMVRHLGLPRERTDVIYNAVEAASFTPEPPSAIAELRREIGVADHAPILITVAKLARLKGHRYLLDALPTVIRDHPAVSLLLVGDGEEEGPLREQCARLGIETHVRFLGQRADVPKLLQAASVFVFPSLSEGFPLSMLEAMASSKPCIAWRIPPFTELVEDGRSGLLVEPRRPDRLSEAIATLAASSKRRRAMGEHSRRLVEQKFDVTIAARKLEGLYQALSKGKVR